MTPHQPHTRSAWAGFGILALLVVVAIIFVVAFMPGGTAQQAQQSQQRAQNVSIDIQAKAIADTITAYRLTKHALPQSLDDLPGPPAAYRDPWGTTFRMDIDESERATTLKLHSAGPDATWDTEDDLTASRPLTLQ